LQQSTVNSAESIFRKKWRPPKIGVPMRPHSSHSAKAGTGVDQLSLILTQ